MDTLQGESAEEMRQDVREDILNILRRVVKVLEKGYFNQLKALSNHTVHNASIFQDQDSIGIAVVTYALEKIVDLSSFDAPAFRTIFNQALRDLEENRVEAYRDSVGKLFRKIADTDQKLKNYIDHVVEFSLIKKGGKIYEHGISLTQTASLLGINQWELMEYLGTTTVGDRFQEEVGVRKRLETARSIFSLP